MRSLLTVQTFGGIDADADELLQDCFQDHDAYTALLAHARPIVIGRKGSGKTAIFRKLVRSTNPDHYSYGHTFSDYPWHHHKLQEVVGVPAETRYVNSWVYLVLLTTAKILLNVDKTQPWSDDAADELSRLEKFVVDTYGTGDPDVTNLFIPETKLRFQASIKVPLLGAELGAGAQSVPMPDLPRISQELNRNIAGAVMKCLHPDKRYFICFDELDRGFDPTDVQYTTMLIGLLLAAKRLHQLAREARKNFSVAIFLREDIYQMLRFEDKNKLTEQLVSFIEWDSPRTNWTLRRLMERRFSVTLASTPTPQAVRWEDVFDETQEMSGRQTKYNHILDRTFRRPRDIIKFCNAILTQYRLRSPGETEKFSNADVVAARATYSEYLLKELDDEIHKHLPQYENYLELVKSLGGLQFDLPEFASVCARRPDLLADGDTPISILRRLYDFSVVGYRQLGGAGGGSAYVWKHINSRVRFDEAAASFRVHPGFMETFGLKKFRIGDASR